MKPITSWVLIIVTLSLRPAWTFPQTASKIEQRLLNPVCVQIAEAISAASDVYYFGETNYDNDVSHWASSSSQVSNCSVEPGTAADVATILTILGSTQTPFAVKGGGHTANPGFSSTTGVQIAMYRFSEVTYDEASQTATIGTGLIWDDVYAVLGPLGVNVVGGRVTGVGVAGFTLGGGYSWKTNQYGLTVDTVTALELVKPNGTIATVTESSDPDLFFALRGSLNNYGIVTKITLKTFPQTQVWGGLITYAEGQISDVNAANAEFLSTVTDPKAVLISAYGFVLGQTVVSQILFYDGPTPPAGIFDQFLAIPALTTDISTRSFLSLVQSSPSNTTSGDRGVFHTVSLLNYTPALLNAILNETVFWGTAFSSKTASLISYDVESFLPSLFSHGTSATAYPPSRAQGLLPLNIYFAWTSELFDAEFQDAVRQSADRIRSLAVAEGQTGIVGAALYTNYAIFDTAIGDIYGANVPRLQAIKTAVDPNNVMGLAGGFKL